MEKKLKDYLHLYLGCDINRAGRIERVDYQLLIYTEINNLWAHTKPILRPLSDMTEEEYKKVASICYKSVYDNEPDFYHEEIVAEKEGGGFKWEEEGINKSEWHYGLTVTTEGVLFSANGNFLTIPHFELFHYLLSKHFDLFGLIESGLAINTQTISNT